MKKNKLLDHFYTKNILNNAKNAKFEGYCKELE